MNKRTVFLSSLAILAVWSGSLYYTFATPPTTPYNVAETLDPTCIPGSANCYVRIVNANNGLTLSGTNLVQLGGGLVQNTTVDTAGKEFSIKNGTVSFVAGADPLGLASLEGISVPGMGIVSDGTTSNGLRSWIFSGQFPSSEESALLSVLGHFDLANNKQSGIVVQDLETNLYNSDQFNSSGMTLRPTAIGMYSRGQLDFSADHDFTLYSSSGYLRFGNYYASRDDTTTSPYYVLGVTDRGTDFGSVGAANFSGSYSGSSVETYRVTIDIAPGSTWTIGSTQNDNNLGSPNNVVYGGTYSGSNFYDYYYLNIEPGGTTFNWSDGSGNNGSGVPIVVGTPITLSQGVTVTFGSASYTANENWSMSIDYQGAPSTTFSWTDGSGGNGSGITIPVGGGSISLSQGVSVEFSTGTFISGDEWHMTTEARGVPAGANNFLYTDNSGYLRQAPTSLLGGGGGAFSLTSQDEGTSLTSATNTYNFTGAGVTATNSGGVVTVNIPGGGGGGADGNIYDNNGTLAGTRTLDANNNNLSFINLGIFSALTQNGNTYIGLFDNITGVGYGGYVLSTRQLIGGIEHITNFGSDISGFGVNWDDLNAGIIDTNGTSNNGAAIEVQADNGLRFRFENAGVFDEYTFPRTDGSANQVLTTDGLGQLSWQTVSGGSDTSIYTNNGTLTANRSLNGNAKNLTFANMKRFDALTEGGTTGLSLSEATPITGGNGIFSLFTTQIIGGDAHSSGLMSTMFGNVSPWNDLKLTLIDINDTTDTGAAIEVHSDNGIRFRFENAGVMDEYIFPRIDGTANQVLSTDGAGQLSWQNVGGLALQLYSENPSTPFTPPTSIGLNSVAIGNGAQASADDMIVWGKNAGLGSLTSTQSTFLGTNAGRGVSGATSINNTFIGANAGFQTSNLNDSIFIGSNTGYGSDSSYFSNFIGQSAGYGADNSDNSTFIGQYTGFRAIGAFKSIFIGSTAGADSNNSFNTVAIGEQAGKGSSSTNSNFLGNSAGKNSSADQSMFLGDSAGYSSLGVSNSTFVGTNAGSDSTTILDSVLMGSYTGSNATNIRYSNLLGYYAGSGSTKIYNSNFFGSFAGNAATNASNSLFIGTNAGNNDTVDNTTDPDDFSILLGNNTSTGGFSNSIALGSFATNTTTNQFMIGSTTRPIDETKIIGSLGTECTITTGTGMACTSDQTLKTNILDLSTDTLSKLLKVKTVTYNWLQNPDSPKQIGFLAQDLEQYFPELVTTDSTGKKAVYYSQITPILVEAIRELNLKITDIHSSVSADSKSLADVLTDWFADAGNGIEKLFAKKIITEELCVRDGSGESCYTRSQLDQALHGTVTNVPLPSTPPTDTPPTPLTCTPPEVLNVDATACEIPVSNPDNGSQVPPTTEGDTGDSSDTPTS